MGFYDWELAKRIECSSDEIRELFPLVSQMTDLAQRARSEGLLCLEDDMSAYESSLLRDGIQLIVDGTDPDFVRSILEKSILANGNTGRELRSELIVMEGVLSIQAADNPRIVRMLLSAFLTPLNDEYMAEAVFTKEDTLIEIAERGPISGYTSLLENLTNFNDRAIQKILRETDNTLLVRAMYGASSQIVNRLLANCSSRAARLILEDMEFMGEISETECHNAQQEILAIIEMLKDQGEIL